MHYTERSDVRANSHCKCKCGRKREVPLRHEASHRMPYVTQHPLDHPEAAHIAMQLTRSIPAAQQQQRLATCVCR
jgi:hypothetical protein